LEAGLLMRVRDLKAIASVLAGLLMALAGASVAADEQPSRGAQMKAAYVFNFLKFVEWQNPASSETLEICFVGAKDVLDALAISTANKTVGARGITVRSVTGKDSEVPDQCDVLYVDSAEDLGTTLPAHGRSILTIGDGGDFTREGGVIRLHMESNRLRFTINVENAKRSGLQVSSNLLKLATRIEQGASL
jgi:hypothetical protein